MPKDPNRVKAGKKSKAKGSRAEREAAKYLIKIGFPSARRGQQFAGSEDTPDVKCDELPNVNIEVKWNQGFTIQSQLLKDAMAQSIRDSGQGKTPVVLWKRNGCPWRLTMIDSNGYLITVCGYIDVRHYLKKSNIKRLT